MGYKLDSLGREYKMIYDWTCPHEKYTVESVIPDISKYKELVLIFINNDFKSGVATMYIPIEIMKFPIKISVDGFMAVESFTTVHLPTIPHTVEFISTTKIKRFTSYDELQIWVR